MESEEVVKEEPVPQKEEVIEINSKSSIFRYFLGAMIIFGACFVICVFVFQIVLLPIDVYGISMQPTINASVTGEGYDKHTDTVFCFRTNDVKYKDIVIVDERVTNEKLIKRVIGEPGQTVTFKRDSIEEVTPTINYLYYSIYVNGVKLDEDYINSNAPYFQLGLTMLDPYSYYNSLVAVLRSAGEFNVTLKENEFFIMGDNRNHSTDSRYFGPITRDEIVGKVVFQVRYGQTLFGALISYIF